MSFTVTDQRTGEQFKRSSLQAAKCLTYERVIPLVHDNLQLGRELRRVYNWKGTGIITIRYGGKFVSLSA